MWTMKRITLRCLVAASALIGIARGEIVQGEEWHPATQSTSPAGKYQLVFLKVKDSELAPRTEDDPRPGPGDAISLYLVQKEPHKVITEIDPNFRCYRSQTNRFRAYWSKDGAKVAIIFDRHVDSGLAVLQKSTSGWHKLPLPEFDWVTKFKEVAKAHHSEAQTMKGFVHDVSFKRASIFVRYTGLVNGSPRQLDVSTIVRYRPAEGRWLMHVDSARAEVSE